MSARLVVEKLSRRFGATVALCEVSLTARAGEVTSVLGENGAGKSTLMKILAGAERADGGTILLDGRDYRPRDPQSARRAGVAMVHQEAQLCPDLTVAENILLGDEPARFGWIDGKSARERVRGALALVQGDEPICADTLVGALGPGTRQLIAIARALGGRERARVIILDEPTSCLSAPESERLFTVIARLCHEGAAVLYISHFLDEVARVAHRFAVLRDGRSVAEGEVARTPKDELVRLMAGRTLERARRPRRTPGEVILRVLDLTGRDKPRSASLELRRGEVVGIAGLIGSGRTELLRAIFGLDPRRRGVVTIGTVASEASPGASLARGLGLVSEDRQREGLAQAMSIADNMTLSKLGPLGMLGFIVPRLQREAASRWIEKLAIRCQGSEQRVGELSGGNQQKVAIARLLHHDVEVALLDEPTRGIDVHSREQIYALIDELARAGKAVLLVSSQLSELLEVCDRILVMCRGRLGPAREAVSSDEHALLTEATGAQ